MPRDVAKEWIGKRPEATPGKLVLLRLYSRQGGLCGCGCGMVMSFERDEIDCDHNLALIDGGTNSESNLRLLLRKHHRAKTSAEASARAEERSHKAKAFTTLRGGKMRGPSFPQGQPKRRATSPIAPKFEGDILARARKP